MSVFDAYAEYYDLLYADKAYQSEVEYLHGHICKHAPNSKTILDLGCGTGRHDQELSALNYNVTGVDQSPRMIQAARSRTVSDEAINFTEGDVRSIRFERRFDVVTALFHVVSYQQLNKDLLKTFETVQRHLSPSGLFLFDCWYGPTVLAVRPEVRVKRLENDDIHITRIAEPEMHPNKNLVDVNYTIFVEDKNEGQVRELKETHTMRYLFVPEINALLDAFGLRVHSYEEWMTGKEAGLDTWSVMFIAKAI